MNYLKIQTGLRNLSNGFVNVQNRLKQMLRHHVQCYHQKNISYTEGNNLPMSKTLFSIVRNWILILAIYLYFIGWAYVYNIMYHFGISLISIDIPFYYLFVYSYTPISNCIALIISNWIVAIITVITIILIYNFTSLPTKKLILVLILILSFPLLYYLSEGSAQQEAQRIRKGHAKRITFTFKKESKQFFPAEFMNANSKGMLRIITHTKDRFYVVYQQMREEELRIPYGSAYEVSKNDVLLAKIDMPDVAKEFSWLKFILGKVKRRT